MEVTAETDTAQGDNKTLDSNVITVDNNNQLTVDSKVTTVASDSLLKKSLTNNVNLEKTKDKQLCNLMVIDDDSLNQLTPTIENKIENSIETAENTKDLPTTSYEDHVNLDAGNVIIKNENQLTKPNAKAPESDSLILTADDELETEMFMPEKEKNDKSYKDKETTSAEYSKEKDFVENNKNDVTTVSPASTSNDINKKRNSTETNGKTETKNVHAFGSRFLWVSNITHSIKAKELKQFISAVGKVTTAKIVTDGKKCYGYVVMDNVHDANECLKVLDNTIFEGRKITVSFTKPATNNEDKNKESCSDNNKSGNCESKLDNEVDNIKYKDNIKNTVRKTRESSKDRSSSVRRHRSRDPLTTKFDCKDRFYRRKKSHSVERCSTDFLRDKLERDRLRRRILEEQRRSRDEMMREMHREEKQRELEFKLKRERRKLQFERELFERERRELFRLDAERRKIEKERLEVMQERTKLEKEYQQTRSNRKNDDFNLSSTIVKPQESMKIFEKPKSKELIDGNFRKTDNKHDRNLLDDAKGVGPLLHRIGLKDDFKMGKGNRERSKSRRGEDLKNYDRSIPPPPNLMNDFDLSSGRKIKRQDFKRDLHGDRKIDHGGRKIEVIDHKYYPDRAHENMDRKNENIYRKPDFDEKKNYNFPERKYDYGRDPKKSRVGEFPGREPSIRNQWLLTTNYSEPWKSGLTTGITNSPLRYQDGNCLTPSYGGANRMPPVYYHSGPSNQEYQRYDHCSQNNGRKYL